MLVVVVYLRRDGRICISEGIVCVGMNGGCEVWCFLCVGGYWKGFSFGRTRGVIDGMDVCGSWWWLGRWSGWCCLCRCE